MFDYLEAEATRLGKEFTRESWTTDVDEVREIPMQQDGYNCGIYLMKYVDWLSEGLWPSWKNPDRMEYFRKRLMVEMVHDKIIA